MLAAGIGSALEWYDFFIYGMASALVFGQLFFPGYDPAVAVLASLPFAYVPLLSPLAAIFHTSPAHPPTFPPLTFHVQVSASGNAGCSWTGRRTTG